MNNSEFTIQVASYKEAQVIRQWLKDLPSEIETLKKINDNDMLDLSIADINEINENLRE